MNVFATLLRCLRVNTCENCNIRPSYFIISVGGVMHGIR